MPSTNLLGVRAKQLANDFTFFYFVVALTQVLWFIIYVSDLAALVRPVNCNTAHNWIIFFFLMGFFALQAVLSSLAMGLSLRGAPPPRSHTANDTAASEWQQQKLRVPASCKRSPAAPPPPPASLPLQAPRWSPPSGAG